MPFRTDLAMERVQPHAGQLPPGVSQEDRTFGNISVNTVRITEDSAAQLIGKPVGRYVTVMTPPFYGSTDLTEEELEHIADEVRGFLPEEGLVLVVGLGNDDITPDAVGPRTAHQILATRHFVDQPAAKQAGLDRLRATSALAPGVLGQTGIETSEIIAAIVRDIGPAAVVVIDALAARDVNRLGTTIQIADTGISPGSGVQNSRRELSRNTLGIPVVSIGIPTVVDAATLVEDIVGDLQSKDARELLRQSGGMMITPREIDVLIEHCCKVLSLTINKALHRDMSFEEIGYLMA